MTPRPDLVPCSLGSVSHAGTKRPGPLLGEGEAGAGAAGFEVGDAAAESAVVGSGDGDCVG